MTSRRTGIPTRGRETLHGPNPTWEQKKYLNTIKAALKHMGYTVMLASNTALLKRDGAIPTADGY